MTARPSPQKNEARATPIRKQRCCASSAEALAHLLLVLDHAADCIEEDRGETADAYLLRAHAAQLRRGREWPGDEVVCPFNDARGGSS